MRNLRFIAIAILFYLIATISIFVYILAEISPRVFLNPAGRLFLLGVFCVLTYIGSRILCKTPSISKSKVIKTTFFVYFILYLLLLATFTLLDPMFGRNIQIGFIFSDPVILKKYLINSCNIIPFATILEYIRALLTQSMNYSTIATNLLGNLVALTPMALFLPMFIKKCEKLKYFVLFTSVAVIVIELLQLVFAIGYCDIDDLILNVSGACVAFIILKAKPIKRVINILIPNDEQRDCSAVSLRQDG